MSPDASARALAALQTALEQLYRLEPASPVTDFLLQHHPDAGAEQLYIREGEDLEVGLAIDPAVIEQLALASSLSAEDLNAFCLAVEGVSHYLFIVHRARQDQRTSVLELELQAEVDKYAAALLLARRRALSSEELRERLYERYRLVEGLSLAQQHRYHKANGLAKRYAQSLERRFVRSRRLQAMVEELRRFYRLPASDKHATIARAA